MADSEEVYGVIRRGVTPWVTAMGDTKPNDVLVKVAEWSSPYYRSEKYQYFNFRALIKEACFRFSETTPNWLPRLYIYNPLVLPQ